MLFEQFEEKIKVFAFNFNFEIKEAEWTRILFRIASKKFSDREISSGFNEFYKMKAKEWNAEFGYRGHPSYGDFVEKFGMLRLHEAREEKKINFDEIGKAFIVNQAMEGGKNREEALLYYEQVMESKQKEGDRLKKLSSGGR